MDGYTLIDPSHAATGIITFNLPILSLQSVSASTDEGMPITVALSASGPFAQGSQQVLLRFSGTGITAGDLDGGLEIAATADFGSGTMAAINVNVLGDSLYEGEELYTLMLARPIGVSSYGIDMDNLSAEGALADAQSAPVLSLTTASAAAEGEAIELTVTSDIAIAATAPDIGFTLTFAPRSGSGITGADFTNGLTHTLTGVAFTGGSGTTATVPVATVDDTLYEGDEDYTATLSAPTGATQGSDLSEDGTITDNVTLPTLSLTAAGAATEGGDIQLTVTSDIAIADTAPDIGFTLSFTAAREDSGIMAADFTDGLMHARTGVKFISGSGTTATVVIKTADDDVYEGDEVYTATLSLPIGTNLGIDTAKNGTLTEDDAPILSLSGGGTIIEGNNIELTVTSNIAFAATAPSLEVRLSASGGEVFDADFSGDWSGGAGTVSLNFSDMTAPVFIPSNDDAILEKSEGYTITLAEVANQGYTVDTNSNSATGTINDNDGIRVQTGQIGIDAAEDDKVNVILEAIANGAAAPSFTETIDVRWDYSGTGIVAREADFDSPPTSVNFSTIGNGTATAAFTVADDTDTAAETYSIKLSSADGYILLAPNNAATGNLILETEISVADAIAAEDGTATLTVQLDEPALKPVTVMLTPIFASSPGAEDAVEADLTATSWGSRNVTIAKDAQSGTLDFTFVTTDLDENTETFELAIAVASPTASFTLANTSATITIVDIVARLDFAASSVSVAEGDSAQLTLNVQRATGMENRAIDVIYRTVAGSADAGNDFTAASSQTVMVAANMDSLTLDISTAADLWVESNETFTVEITAATPSIGIGSKLRLPETATVTINDDDNAEVRIIAASRAVSANENSNARITVEAKRKLGFIDSIAVDLTPTPSNSPSATADADYTSTNQQHAFPGSSIIETHTFLIPIAMDSIDDAGETFLAILSLPSTAPTGVNLIAAESRATITIDESRILRLQSAPDPVTEGNGISLTVTANENISNTLMATLSITGDAANVDFDNPWNDLSEIATLNFNGNATATVTIPTAEDSVLEPPESYTVTLTAITGQDYTVNNSSNSVSGVINDNDGIRIKAGQIDIDATEGDMINVVLEAVANDGSDITVVSSFAETVAVTWDYSGTGIVAMAADFDSPPSSVNFSTASDGTATAAFTVAEDADTAAEEYSIKIKTATGYTVIALDNAATGNLNPPPAIQISVEDLTVTEDGIGTLTVQLNASAPTDLTVSLTPMFAPSPGAGDAVEADLAEASRGVRNVAISKGSTSGTIDYVFVTSDTDEDTETFTVAIAVAVPANGYTVIDPSVTVTIVDVIARLSFTDASVTVLESDPAQLTLDVQRATGIENRAIEVSYQTVAGTAAAADDFTSTTATVTIAAGETSATLMEIPTVDDMWVEEDETFTVEITATASPGIGSKIALPDPATVTLSDDDNAEIYVGPTSKNVYASEGSRAKITVKVKRKIRFTEDIAVRLTLADDDPVSATGRDYIATEANLMHTFSNGASNSHDFTISILNDSDDDEGETFLTQLNLQKPSPAGVHLIGGDTVTVIIADTVSMSVNILSRQIELDEGQVIQLKIDVSAPPIKPLSVPIRIAGRGSSPAQQTENADFDADWSDGEHTLQLNFQGERSIIVPIPTVNDGAYELEEDFIITLQPGDGYTLNEGTAIGRIKDNEGIRLVPRSDQNVLEHNYVDVALEAFKSVENGPLAMDEDFDKTIGLTWDYSNGVADENDFIVPNSAFFVNGRRTARFQTRSDTDLTETYSIKLVSGTGVKVLDPDNAVTGQILFRPTLNLPDDLSARLAPTTEGSIIYIPITADRWPGDNIDVKILIQGHASSAVYATTSASDFVLPSVPGQDEIPANFASFTITQSLDFSSQNTVNMEVGTISGDEFEFIEKFRVILEPNSGYRVGNYTYLDGSIVNPGGIGIRSHTLPSNGRLKEGASFDLNLGVHNGSSWLDTQSWFTSPTETVHITWFVNGMANGEDFILPRTVLFTKSATAQVSITAKKDMDTSDEDFSLTLGVTNDKTLSYDHATIRGIVGVDSVARLSFADVEAVEEGETARLTLNLERAAGQESAAIEVSYRTVAGSAEAGSDFTAVATQTITIASDETNAILEIHTIENHLIENDETFTVEITAASVTASEDKITTPYPLTVTIADDDNAEIRLSMATLYAAEGSNANITVDVLRKPRFTDSIAVTLTPVAISATADTDYEANVQMHTIPRDASRHTFQIPIQADADDDAGETFRADLSIDSGAPDGVSIIGSDSTTVIITPPLILSLSGGGSVTEGDSIDFSVTPSVTFPEPVVVRMVISGTAEGTDFAGVWADREETMELNFSSGSATVTILTENDGAYESEEDYTVTLLPNQQLCC
ncbi:MAG: Calx-beta domain-containing protein [Candidatus Eutrophobiaceae bacterium]